VGAIDGVKAGSAARRSSAERFTVTLV
jgi:hypothetical protein